MEIGLDAVVIHVPHSSYVIPEEYKSCFVLSEEKIKAEHLEMSDHYCDELYKHEGYTNYAVAGVSRLLCDTERFRNDEEESMSRLGMGAVYTRTHNGRKLKKVDSALHEEILQKYYDPHHARLTEMVDKAVEKYGKCLIIDGHSFSGHSLLKPVNPLKGWADFDIGSDRYHTPEELVKLFVKLVEEAGYSSAVNAPFSGSLVPMKYYGKDKRVTSIMLEINRRTYMNTKTGEKLPEFMHIKEQVGVWMNKIFEAWREL